MQADRGWSYRIIFQARLRVDPVSFSDALISNWAKELGDQWLLFKAKLLCARARENLSIELDGRLKWPGEVSSQEALARRACLRLRARLTFVSR